MLNKIHQPLKAFLLDDEPEACRNLQSLLQQYWPNRIQVSGIANSTDVAEPLIQSLQPDVVFIDIEMPGENAFRFLQRISPFPFEIIFVTAYDEYALRAFKLNAIDYILKPISLEELETAIHKLEEKCWFKRENAAASIKAQSDYAELNQQIQNKEQVGKIVLRSKTEVHILQFSDIYYLEADGSYCRFYFNDHGKTSSLLMSRSISEYEELMPEDVFYRIHKSYLINCKHIAQIRKDEQYTIEMMQGAALPLSRRRHAGLLDFLEKYVRS
jgi:two-component system, LytTR family, response regulator